MNAADRCWSQLSWSFDTLDCGLSILQSDPTADSNPSQHKAAGLAIYAHEDADGHTHLTPSVALERWLVFRQPPSAQ